MRNIQILEFRERVYRSPAVGVHCYGQPIPAWTKQITFCQSLGGIIYHKDLAAPYLGYAFIICHPVGS